MIKEYAIKRNPHHHSTEDGGIGCLYDIVGWEMFLGFFGAEEIWAADNICCARKLTW